jgi:hypothetical protein
VKLLVAAFLLNVGLPAMVSAAVLAAALAVARRAAPSRGDVWPVAPAIAAGYLAGHFAVAWPMSDVTDRLPWLVLAATALGTLEAAWPAPSWARWENRLLSSALTLAVMLSAAPAIVEALGTRQSTLWIVALGAGIVASWTNLEALAGRITGVAIVLPLLVVAGGASVALAIWSIVPGQLGGALTAALAGAWVASWWGGPLSLARGGVTVLVLVLAALIVYAHVYAGMATSCVALLAASPLALWVTRIGPIRRLPPWQAALIGAVAALVPVAVASGLSHAATSSASAYGY